MAIEAALRTQGLSQFVASAGCAPVAPSPPPPGAAPRNTAPHSQRPAGRTNPRRTPQRLKPKQLSGARLLLAGRSITQVAAALGVHRYTVTRWQSDPQFQAELRRQTADAAAQGGVAAGAAPRNVAPHGATSAGAIRQNEPTAGPRYSGALTRAILTGLPRPGERADP
jgi:hypothetical protein